MGEVEALKGNLGAAHRAFNSDWIFGGVAKAMNGWLECLPANFMHRCNLPVRFDDMSEVTLQEAAWPLPKGDKRLL